MMQTNVHHQANDQSKLGNGRAPSFTLKCYDACLVSLEMPILTGQCRIFFMVLYDLFRKIIDSVGKTLEVCCLYYAYFDETFINIP